jgi:hypothetical protein
MRRSSLIYFGEESGIETKCIFEMKPFNLLGVFRLESVLGVET